MQEAKGRGKGKKKGPPLPAQAKAAEDASEEELIEKLAAACPQSPQLRKIQSIGQLLDSIFTWASCRRVVS